MAYTFEIKPNTVDSHQTSPSYVLTFVRFENRDTENFKLPNVAFNSVRDPLIITSDCLSIGVSNSKNSHLTSAQMVMSAGDINYSTAIATGDFVIINLVDDEATALDIANRARSKKPINGFKDGFKGIYRVQTVKRNLRTNSSGFRSFTYTISAQGFTEFNQVIYFNRYLTDTTNEQQAQQLKLNNAILGADEILTKNQKGLANLNTIFRNLVGLLVGKGFGDLGQPEKGDNVRNFNRNFIIPKEIFPLLGIKKGSRAADLFRFYVGVEQYSSNAKDKAKGLNPLVNPDGNFYNSSTLSGAAYIQAEFWAQVTAWSILQQYKNSVVNEMFTTYKYTPEGKVMPSVIYRQKPFTSEHYKGPLKQTKFLDLPRWKIAPEMVLDYDFGRDEAARINFVQIVGNSRDLGTAGLGLQAALTNFKFDQNDIARSGMRPHIEVSNFDFIEEKKQTLAPTWTKMVYDWLNGLHLKENGTMVCVGLYEPISVGENLQVEDTVFHIETVTHQFQVNADGVRSFETTLQLSYGVDVSSNKAYPVYPEMKYPTALEQRENSDLYGGFSDSQDTFGRENGETKSDTISKSFLPNISKKLRKK